METKSVRNLACVAFMIGCGQRGVGVAEPPPPMNEHVRNPIHLGATTEPTKVTASAAAPSVATDAPSASAPAASAQPPPCTPAPGSKLTGKCKGNADGDMLFEAEFKEGRLETLTAGKGLCGTEIDKPVPMELGKQLKLRVKWTRHELPAVHGDLLVRVQGNQMEVRGHLCGAQSGSEEVGIGECTWACDGGTVPAPASALVEECRRELHATKDVHVLNINPEDDFSSGLSQATRCGCVELPNRENVYCCPRVADLVGRAKENCPWEDN